MIRIPKGYKYYPEAGIMLQGWERDLFQSLSKGYTLTEATAITGRTRRMGEYLLQKVRDDVGVSNTVELIAYLMRKKVIK